MSKTTLTESETDISTALDDASANLSRRRFLKMGAGALGALVLLEIGGVGLLYLQPRQSAGAFGKVMVAGDVDEFPHGSVTEFIDGRFFLIRTEDGGFLALYRRCPHLGCTINWDHDDKEFVCPCHASSFDVYGDFNNAPIPRPLDTFSIAIENQKVLVDISKRRQREKFASEQLIYADI